MTSDQNYLLSRLEDLETEVDNLLITFNRNFRNLQEITRDHTERLNVIERKIQRQTDGSNFQLLKFDNLPLDAVTNLRRFVSQSRKGKKRSRSKCKRKKTKT